MHKLILVASVIILLLSGITALWMIPDGPVNAQVFATNTPRPPDPLETTPDALLGQYALRLWTEQDLITMLSSQLTRLEAGDTNQQIAVQLTLYELEQRFPGAPHNDANREALIEHMLNLPRGIIDMRALVRPMILKALNQQETTTGTFTINGFSVQVIPLNLDGVEPMDAVLQIAYPANLYNDYIPVINTKDGRYMMPDIQVSIPAAPYNTIQSLELIRADDVNVDGLDEIVISIDRGDINDEWLVLAWRSDRIINVVEPNQRLLVGEMISWPETDDVLNIYHYHVESPRWHCLSQLQMRWEWDANFYRPKVELNERYTDRPTVGCAIYSQEPIFGVTSDEAITTVSTLLQNAPMDDEGYFRGSMGLAMLYYINGQTRSATEEVNRLESLSADNTWLQGQIEAYQRISAGDYDPVGVCEALIIADEYGACDIDQLIGQMLAQNGVLRDSDIVAHLQGMGLPVLESTMVSRPGLRDRLYVNFGLTGASWWAFAPNDDLYYVPEIAEAPVAFAEASMPAGLLQAPRQAYEVLIIRDDPIGTLNILQNLELQNPGVPLSAAARYLQALSYDMVADRQAARSAYFDLWKNFVDSSWGRLAGAHLEKR